MFPLSLRNTYRDEIENETDAAAASPFFAMAQVRLVSTRMDGVGHWIPRPTSSSLLAPFPPLPGHVKCRHRCARHAST